MQLDILLISLGSGLSGNCGVDLALFTAGGGGILRGSDKENAVADIPKDAQARRDVRPVICYPPTSNLEADMALYLAARETAQLVSTTIVAPRDARAFHVSAGQFFRISCPEGPQVGDLNLFNAQNTQECFYSGKTRALHGTHLNIGDRMWSSFPYMRPMATVVADTLAWYGTDPYGGRVHDVIGTRCDPYTHNVLSQGGQYHHCCHSNLTRAMVGQGYDLDRAEALVHDVLNVFMCTGFTVDAGQYFMKASPVRQGDYLEFFAEIDLMGVLSACPGGDCGSEHSSDVVQCYPLQVDVFAPAEGALEGWASPPVNGYDRGHGCV